MFSSSILIMVDDVKAVNSFMSAVKDSNTTVSDAMIDCDYIEYVILSLFYILSP